MIYDLYDLNKKNDTIWLTSLKHLMFHIKTI